MKTKHTPGPWAVHPFTAQVDAFDSGSPLPVCQMLWPTELRGEHETEANAHLIAAAPDMLAALRAFVAASCVVGSLGDELSEPILQARAAIAKAECSL